MEVFVIGLCTLETLTLYYVPLLISSCRKARTKHSPVGDVSERMSTYHVAIMNAVRSTIPRHSTY